MIHTSTPVADIEPSWHYYLDLTTMYRSVLNHVIAEKPRIYRFDEISSFGAMVKIHYKDRWQPLTKKKMPWRDILHTFYGEVRDVDRRKTLIREIKKHGEIIIEIDDGRSAPNYSWAPNFWEK